MYLFLKHRKHVVNLFGFFLRIYILSKHFNFVFLYRFCDGFKNALTFFRSYLIDTNTNVTCVLDIFVNVHKFYNRKLRLSINKDILSGSLPRVGNPLHYNYIIMDGFELNKILENYNKNDLLSTSIENEDFNQFKKICIYVGKGTKSFQIKFN